LLVSSIVPAAAQSTCRCCELITATNDIECGASSTFLTALAQHSPPAASHAYTDTSGMANHGNRVCGSCGFFGTAQQCTAILPTGNSVPCAAQPCQARSSSNYDVTGYAHASCKVPPPPSPLPSPPPAPPPSQSPPPPSPPVVASAYCAFGDAGYCAGGSLDTIARRIDGGEVTSLLECWHRCQALLPSNLTSATFWPFGSPGGVLNLASPANTCYCQDACPYIVRDGIASRGVAPSIALKPAQLAVTPAALPAWNIPKVGRCRNQPPPFQTASVFGPGSGPRRPHGMAGTLTSEKACAAVCYSRSTCIGYEVIKTGDFRTCYFFGRDLHLNMPTGFSQYLVFSTGFSQHLSVDLVVKDYPTSDCSGPPMTRDAVYYSTATNQAYSETKGCFYLATTNTYIKGEYCDMSSSPPRLRGKWYPFPTCSGTGTEYNHVADGTTCTTQSGGGSSLYDCKQVLDINYVSTEDVGPSGLDDSACFTRSAVSTEPPSPPPPPPQEVGSGAGPLGWIVETTPRTFESARTHCASAHGMDLAVIHSSLQNEEIRDLPVGTQTIGTTTGNVYWIGYTDSETEGVWRWVDQLQTAYTNWQSGEPNNVGNEDCAVYVGGSQGWQDRPCTASYPFVCGPSPPPLTFEPRTCDQPADESPPCPDAIARNLQYITQWNVPFTATTSCANNRWDLQSTGDTLAGYHFLGHWASGCPGSSLTFYKRRDGIYSSSCNSDADCSLCEAYCRTISATYKRCEPRLYNDQSRRNDCQESWSIPNFSPSQLLASCPLSSSPPTQCPTGWTAPTGTNTRCFRRAYTGIESTPHGPASLTSQGHGVRWLQSLKGRVRLSFWQALRMRSSPSISAPLPAAQSTMERRSPASARQWNRHTPKP
jgi:hypothetical protein